MILILALPNESHGQLLENRGKLRNVKKERRGFFDFLRKQNTKDGEKKDKLYVGPSPPWKRTTPPASNSNFTIPEKFKFRNSNFRPETSFFQGFGKGFSRLGEDWYYKRQSKDRSGTVVNYYPITMFHNHTHKYQGFSKGHNALGKKLFFKELSRERSGLVISVIPTFKNHNNTHKYQGFDKGRNQLGNWFFYKELSRERSGNVIDVIPIAMNHNNTHKYQGFSKGLTRLGRWFFFNEVTRGQAKFEGAVQLMSYKQRLELADVAAAEMAEYDGGFKIRTRTPDMHPSATYLWGKKASSHEQKEMLRKLNIFWVRLNGNKVQPDAVTEQPKKLKYDKKEKDLWNY